ncbi:LolA family protein [Thermomonas flagellata]|uniref:LolA family protein n=1 Tax=Thermomonas flagellata TaxID=2888524 RepID=UPI001F04DD1C|nr:hypothetical protein [Thermomonas flagellata]
MPTALRPAATLLAALSLAACQPVTPPAASTAATATAAAEAKAPSTTPTPAAAAAPSAAIAGTATPASGSADARAQVQASAQKFLALQRYHARLTTRSGATGKPQETELDFVAPDRYRLQSATGGTQVVIGDAVHRPRQGQATKQAADPATLAALRLPQEIARGLSQYTAEAAGMQMVQGRPSRKFVLRRAASDAGEVVWWIDRSGYPIQLEARTGQPPRQVTLQYSRWDDPAIAIAAPQ